VHAYCNDDCDETMIALRIFDVMCIVLVAATPCVIQRMFIDSYALNKGCVSGSLVNNPFYHWFRLNNCHAWHCCSIRQTIGVNLHLIKAIIGKVVFGYFVDLEGAGPTAHIIEQQSEPSYC